MNMPDSICYAVIRTIDCTVISSTTYPLKRCIISWALLSGYLCLLLIGVDMKLISLQGIELSDVGVEIKGTDGFARHYMSFIRYKQVHAAFHPEDRSSGLGGDKC
jgi:hypothetical protein